MKKDLFSIGWASADVSTQGPINIPGQFHMRISQGVLDPITATALWLSDEKDDVCFVSLDLVTLRGSLTDFVYAEVRKRNPEIPVKKIILNATHTHTGPGFHKNNLLAGDFRPEMLSQSDSPKRKKAMTEIEKLLDDDPEIPTTLEIMNGGEYRDFLVKRIADVICEAYDKRSSGAIAYGYGFAVVAHSRRCVYHDDLSKRPGAIQNSTHGVNGHGMMYGSTADDKFSGYEGGADPYVNLLFTFDDKKKLTGVLVNVPCPSQNSENLNMLSASYWHDTKEAIRKKFGNIFILAQSAAGGDLAPRQLHYLEAEKRRYALKYGKNERYGEEFRRKDIAERIAACVQEVYSWAKKDLIYHAPIHHEVLDLSLSRRMITPEDYKLSCDRLKELSKVPFKQEADCDNKDAALRNNSILVSERNRCKGIIRRWEEQQHTKKFKTQAHVLSIGDIAFATNQFELYQDFQHRIQGRSPFIQTFIVQLSGVTGDGGGSYLATKRGYLNRGYSASRYCNLVSWKGGNELVEKTLKALNKLWDKEKK